MHVENRQTIDAFFTEIDLSPQEQGLVNSVALWQNMHEWSDLRYDSHGRSLVFRSPSIDEEDNYNAKFAGLQILGVGGAPSAIRDGFLDHEEPQLFRVNESDCSEELAHIFQKRNINNEGILEFSQRQYAPTAGMDQPEAESRKKMTEIFDIYSKSQRDIVSLFPFVTPHLAAEGIYTEKKDPDGRPLHFQAYRVPLLPRAPTQLAREAYENGVESGIEKLSVFSFLLGDTLRILHDNEFAYMDGHIGNMSLLEKAGEFPRIYITDLGSIKDFSGHPYGDRYRGLDIYAHFIALEKFEPLFQTAANDSSVSLTVDFEYMYWTAGGRALIEGYFYRDFVREGLADDPEAFTSRVNEYFIKIAQNYTITHKDPQGFINYFEKFFQDTKN